MAVPKLDAVKNDPALAEALPDGAFAALYADVARLEADLRAQFLARGMSASPTTSAIDRALNIDEAAGMLGMTRDFLYRKWARLKLGYKDADGHIKFSRCTVQRYIRTRAGR